MTETFVHDLAAHRFELRLAGGTAVADYVVRDGRLVIHHVEAPVSLRGTGAAGRLMQALTHEARIHGRKLTPTCPYAVDWFAKHPDAADLLD